MAYSAIAHMGFILLGISTGTLDGLISSIVYIVIYIIMSIATFSVILTAFNGTKHKYLTDIRGLGKTQPVLAIALALTLLSIAGIPPLAGFLSKFYVILNLIEAKNMIGAITAIVITVAASYYYLKIIKTMYFTEGSIIENPPRLTISPLVGVIMGQALYFIITLMVYPKPVLMLPMVYIMNSLI
jgi:NADH-quinone oxidoreductase subunit N